MDNLSFGKSKGQMAGKIIGEQSDDHVLSRRSSRRSSRQSSRHEHFSLGYHGFLKVQNVPETAPPLLLTLFFFKKNLRLMKSNEIESGNGDFDQNGRS